MIIIVETGSALTPSPSPILYINSLPTFETISTNFQWKNIFLPLKWNGFQSNASLFCLFFEIFLSNWFLMSKTFSKSNTCLIFFVITIQNPSSPNPFSCVLKVFWSPFPSQNLTNFQPLRFCEGTVGVIPINIVL